MAWSRPGTNPYVHTDLGDFARVNGQERLGVSYAGQSILDQRGGLRSDVAARAPQVAAPLPASIATALGRAAGERVLGSGL